MCGGCGNKANWHHLTKYFKAGKCDGQANVETHKERGHNNYKKGMSTQRNECAELWTTTTVCGAERKW